MTIRMRIDLPRFERELEGAARVYRELPTAYKRRVLPPALLVWARIIRDTARNTTVFKDKTGILRRSIRAYRFKQRPGLPPGAFVAAGPYLPRHRAFHAHLVEFGHEGTSPAPPHPFMGEAVRSAQPRANAAFIQAFRKRVRIADDALIAKFGTR